MKIRFEVNQAEAFRRGVNVPQSIVTIDVNPAELSQNDRDIIADRLDGIDVGQLNEDGKIAIYQSREVDPVTHSLLDKTRRIVAGLPTFDGLMETIRKNEAEVLKLWKLVPNGTHRESPKSKTSYHTDEIIVRAITCDHARELAKRDLSIATAKLERNGDTPLSIWDDKDIVTCVPYEGTDLPRGGKRGVVRPEIDE